MRDSNPRHPACKAGALPTELIARPLGLGYFIAGTDGVQCGKLPGAGLVPGRRGEGT